MHNNYPLPMRRNYAGPLAHPAEVTFTDIPFNEESDLLRHYCSVIYRHLWMILGILAVAEMVTLIFLARAPRLYTSSSTISIEAQAPDVMARDNRNNDDN